MRKYWVITTFIFILALGSFFRFYLITEVPPGLYTDEAMNGNNALEALETGNFKVFYPENNGREGLFINIQALSVWIFGNTPWALRGVSALFGVLAIVGVFLLARELFPGRPAIALLSSFFIATSYWHINFSRIGFRAISVPFFASFALFFLLRGFRRKSIWDFVLAGIFTGLGLQTYIAFRFMPFVIAVPILFALLDWWRGNVRIQNSKFKIQNSIECGPCAIVLFAFVTLVVFLPLGIYFMQKPADFFGRSGQVSIFTAESPAKEFLISNVATLGMFFVRGDCNFRHNYGCLPELHPVAAFFLLLGIIFAIRGVWGKNDDSRQLTLLAAWFVFMMFPATLTREGLPHALRSIGMIPPVMILSAYGAVMSWRSARVFLDKQEVKWPKLAARMQRIKRELAFVVAVVVLFIPIATYDTYFLRWRSNVKTYHAFSVDLWHMGQYLDGLPDDTKKYVIANSSVEELHALPMAAQTVMYATKSYTEHGRRERNIIYVLPHEISHKISVSENEKVLVALMDYQDRRTRSKLQKKFPDLKPFAAGDFAILKNY